MQPLTAQTPCRLTNKELITGCVGEASESCMTGAAEDTCKLTQNNAGPYKANSLLAVQGVYIVCDYGPHPITNNQR